MSGERDLFGVGMFTCVVLFLLLIFGPLAYMVVQDSKHESECIKAGKVYIDGNCLPANSVGGDD